MGICDARENGAARCRRSGGTYFSNFVAVGPAHSGLSFSPSLSLGIVSAGGIMGCEDGVEGFVRQVLQMELAWLSRGRERARWSAEFLSITARDHLLGDECVIT